MEKWLDRVLPFFSTAFINNNRELILEPKSNIYFRLNNFNNAEEDFDCKMIAYLSRPAHKHWKPYWQRWFLRGINSYFRQNWSREEMGLIYTRLGNDVNRPLCKRFIASGFDMELLKEKSE